MSHKRQILLYPEGTKIDNSNFSAWKYPDGAQFWKNFSGVDGKLRTIKENEAGYLRFLQMGWI